MTTRQISGFRQLLAQLEPAQREVIELAVFAHLTYREIAARLGVPDVIVKRRMLAGLRAISARIA